MPSYPPAAAIQSGKLWSVAYLLKSGADPNLSGQPCGNTALHYASSSAFSWDESTTMREAIFRLVLHGASPAVVNANGFPLSIVLL